MITDKLIEEIIAKQNPTCVGLDTALEYLPEGTAYSGFSSCTGRRGWGSALLWAN